MAKYSTPAWTNGAAPAINADNLTAMGQGIECADLYGVCSTAAATRAKTVTVTFSGTLSLYAGLRVTVKFSNSNTASAPTLNVNSTGAKAIKSYGTTNATTWIAGQVLTFVYDGTNWLIDGIDGYTKGQSLSSSTASAINDLTGSTPATPDAALDLLATAISGVSGGVYIGSYTGTGTYGAGNPVTITAPFAPKVLLFFIYGPHGTLSDVSFFTGAMYVDEGIVEGFSFGQAMLRNSALTITRSGNSVSWYYDTVSSYGVYAQGNVFGLVYRYIALG